MRQLGYLLLSLSFLATVAQGIHFWPRLPERISSHFDVNGLADGWVSRQTFFMIHIGLQMAMAALFLGLARFGDRLPDAMFSMPHKEYWLHPSRRATTIHENAKLLILISGITATFLTALFQIICQLNEAGKSRLPMHFFIPLVVGYVVLVLAIALFASYKFARIPVEPES